MAEAKRQPLFTAATAVPIDLAELEVLLAGGERKKLSDAERRALLERVRAGEHAELSFGARTYVQSDKPNRNHIRFKDGALKKIARSFKGQPFLRDHGQYALDDRGGTILESELVEVSEGTSAIDMTIKAVKPWAVLGLLDGTIDRFSIGWQPTGPVLCSVHKRERTGTDGCYCWPGKVVEGETVEAIFTAADGVEVSAVNVPAVPEAKGVEIRAALDALGASGNEANEATYKEQRMDREKLALSLGLAANATEQDINAAIAASTKIKAERDDLALKLAASKELGQHTEARLAALEAESKAALAAAEAERVEARIRELRACGAIPVAPDSGAEKVLRAAAKRGGLAELELAATDYKPGAFSPVGAPMQLGADGKDKKVDGGPAAAILALPDVKVALKANGLSDEDFIKYGPHTLAANGGV